jgi:hypothetical protein
MTATSASRAASLRQPTAATTLTIGGLSPAAVVGLGISGLTAARQSFFAKNRNFNQATTLQWNGDTR